MKSRGWTVSSWGWIPAELCHLPWLRWRSKGWRRFRQRTNPSPSAPGSTPPCRCPSWRLQCNAIFRFLILHYFRIFFNVGPPKEDIFSGHLLSPVFQFIITHFIYKLFLMCVMLLRFSCLLSCGSLKISLCHGKLDLHYGKKSLFIGFISLYHCH